MITLIYSLCAKVEELSVYIGSFITIAIDILASIILLVKAIKAKNVSFKDAMAGIIKIFSRKNKDEADDTADDIVEEVKGGEKKDDEKEDDDVQSNNS